MSISLEARAMAGEDYANFGMEMEEWERADLEETPAHLLAYEDDEEPWFLGRNSNATDSICSGHHDEVRIEDREEVLGKSEECTKLKGRFRLRALIMMIAAVCRLILLLRVPTLTQ